MDDQILALLGESPGLTAGQIAAKLELNRSPINSTLYKLLQTNSVKKAAVEGSAAPIWSIAESSIQPNPGRKAPNDLHSWQEKALRLWKTEGCRGMVEAVTGSGKTRFALEAMKLLQHATTGSLFTLIVVPTITLMDQWCAETKKFLGDDGANKLGRLGNGFRDDFSQCSTIIAVANSAARRINELLAFACQSDRKTFLIADEVHRLIYAEQHGRVLDFPFTYTLGMSATLDKQSDARLGKRFYRFTFEDAKRDGIVPHFDLVQVGVSLTGRERTDYNGLTEQLQDQFRLLKRLYAAELKGFDEPRLEGRVLRELSRIYQRTDEPDIRRLFTLLFRRAAISHKCQQKIELAKRLGEFLMRQKGRGKRIFFFERIASAVEVEEEIEEGRCVDESFRLVADSLRSVDPHAWCKTIQSGLTSTDRQQILDEFRRFPAATLLCCRMLDEGLNVPEIDVAVLVSSSQTKRQRIQRIGRALRTTADNVRPLIISFYVSETTDAKTIQHDDELFKGVATIHRANAQNLIDQVQDLLASRDGK